MGFVNGHGKDIIEVCENGSTLRRCSPRLHSGQAVQASSRRVLKKQWELLILAETPVR